MISYHIVGKGRFLFCFVASCLSGWYLVWMCPQGGHRSCAAWQICNGLAHPCGFRLCSCWSRRFLTVLLLVPRCVAFTTWCCRHFRVFPDSFPSIHEALPNSEAFVMVGGRCRSTKGKGDVLLMSPRQCRLVAQGVKKFISASKFCSWPSSLVKNCSECTHTVFASCLQAEPAAIKGVLCAKVGVGFEASFVACWMVKGLLLPSNDPNCTLMSWKLDRSTIWIIFYWENSLFNRLLLAKWKLMRLQVICSCAVDCVWWKFPFLPWGTAQFW